MRNWLKEHTMTQLLLLSVLMECTLEILFRRSPIKALLFIWQSPHIFLLNVLIVLATYCICAPFKKRFAIKMTVSLLWLTFGIVNFIISLYRSHPFTMVDLLLVKDLFSLIHVYFSVFQIVLMFAAIIGVFLAIVLLFVRSKKQELLPMSKRLTYTFTPAALAILICALGIRFGVLDTAFLNLHDSYLKSGFAYCFISTFADVGMAEPKTYSPETITELDETLFEEETKTDASVSDSAPNVLFLQLESFFDLSQVLGIDLPEDPAPNYTRLKSEGPSGYLYVPTSGGGTVNTEMEVLTGMNINFFGAGEYPYYTILRESCCESLAYNMRDLGLTATAIHNNSGSFYSRHEVYTHLGFDRYDSVEYMSNLTYTPLGWARDQVLSGEIMTALTTTPGRDFVFTVAVQTHGAYPNLPDNQRTSIDLGTGEDGINPYSLAYYAEQVRQVDAFLGDLLQQLEAFDEPVVLVVYGDHLPALNLTNEILSTGSLFTTEYAIWSNFGLQGEDMNLEAYQLTARVLDLLNLDCGTLFYFHQNRVGTENYLEDLNLLQYDMLYGEHSIYGGQMPFEQTQLTMGLRDIRLEKASMQYGYLSVTGSGFTPRSRIYIHDELQETLYISDTQLIVPDFEPEGDELVSVGQVSDDQIALSYTNTVPISEE